MDDRRTARFFGDIDQALHSQQSRPEILGDAVEQELKLVTGERLLAHQKECFDALLAEMGAVTVSAIMIIMVLMLVLARIMVVSFGRRPVGLDVEPAARICFGIGSVEARRG